jgi:hypothetical protein
MVQSYFALSFRQTVGPVDDIAWEVMVGGVLMLLLKNQHPVQRRREAIMCPL